MEAHPPRIVAFHEPRTPTLTTALPGQILEGRLHAQAQDTIGAVPAVDLPAGEEHAFRIHGGHDPARGAGRRRIVRERAEMPQTGPAIPHGLAPAFQLLEPRKHLAHGLNVELPRVPVPVRL